MSPGDPGVGKTAIAEGLAQRLVMGNLKVDGMFTVQAFVSVSAVDLPLRR